MSCALFKKTIFALLTTIVFDFLVSDMSKRKCIKYAWIVDNSLMKCAEWIDNRSCFVYNKAEALFRRNDSNVFEKKSRCLFRGVEGRSK